MKAALLTCFIFVLVLGTGCVMSEQVSFQKKVKLSSGEYPMKFEKTITKKINCQYILVLPKGYDKQEKTWPLILFLHGAGERGSNLEKVKAHGPIKYAQKNKDFPFVLVCPQCPEEQWWSTEVLINLLDDIVSQYNIDRSRIYLTGLSMGGFGTWDLASMYPDRFAAIAPVCGGGLPFYAGRLKNIPVWAFHGDKDNVVPLEKSREMVNAVNIAGGNAKLTIYPNLGHDSWTVTYDNKELYDWFLSNVKKAK
jgi:predicted peptidase